MLAKGHSCQITWELQASDYMADEGAMVSLCEALGERLWDTARVEQLCRAAVALTTAPHPAPQHDTTAAPTTDAYEASRVFQVCHSPTLKWQRRRLHGPERAEGQLWGPDTAHMLLDRALQLAILFHKVTEIRMYAGAAAAATKSSYIGSASSAPQPRSAAGRLSAELPLPVGTCPLHSRLAKHSTA